MYHSNVLKNMKNIELFTIHIEFDSAYCARLVRSPQPHEFGSGAGRERTAN